MVKRIFRVRAVDSKSHGGSLDPFMKLFPYKPREYQVETMRFITSIIRRKNICLHAPTGFGKTPLILASLLSIIENGGGKIIWAVRTGNETDRPIEELKKINEHTRKKFFGLSFRGKRDMCLLARELEIRGYEEVTFLCQKERYNCPFYREIRVNKPNNPLLYSEILNLGKEKETCPYFLQRKLLKFADVISLSYNYIVSPLSWSLRKSVPFHSSFLVVDEAHNLQFAAGNANSSKISLRSIERSLKELDLFEKNEVKGFRKLLTRIKEGILSLSEEIIKDDISFNPAEFLEKNRVFEADLELLLNLGRKIKLKKLDEGKAPVSSIHRVASFWLSALQNSHTEGISFLVFKKKGTVYVEMWDMRASEILKDIWSNFRKCIFCSGSLKPISAFSEIIGLKSYESKVIPSFFTLSKIKTYIIKGLTTKGEELPAEMRYLYSKALKKFLSRAETNAAVFTASYRIQNELLDSINDASSFLQRKVFIEREDMSGDEGREILNEFKKSVHKGEPCVLVAPMGGRFAEGADFPGEELENIFLVGIPFDKLTNRTELYIQYYQKTFGEDKGKFYAYFVPALRRASQALGRALRSKEDKATFVCGDERYGFRNFFSLLPDYVQRTAIQVSVHEFIEKTSIP